MEAEQDTAKRKRPHWEMGPCSTKSRHQNRSSGQRRGHQRKDVCGIGRRDARSRLPIHDSLFKHLLTKEETAGHFLAELLPQHVAALFDGTPPKVLPDTFVDGDLRQLQTDVLLLARLKDGREVFVYCLMEHKSRSERLARKQLLKYVWRIVEKFWTDDSETMPAVLPIIVHNGPKPWAYPTELRELAGPLPEDLLAHLLSLDHVVVDLCELDDNALSADPRLRGGLMALKYAKWEEAELLAKLDEILAIVILLDSEDRRLIIFYLTLAFRSAKPVRASLRRIAAGDQADEVMQSIWQPLREIANDLSKEEIAEAQAEARAHAEARGQAEARAQAEAEARAQAEAKAEAEAEARAQAEAKAEAEAEARAQDQEQFRATLAATLLGLAGHRFTSVSAEARALILGAATPTLQGWLAELLSAPNLETLLGIGQPERGAPIEEPQRGPAPLSN